MTPDGLIIHDCRFGFDETLQRLEAEIAARALTLFARIDHAAGAHEVGLALNPTTVLVFGAARGGTPLMAAAQTAGIDLPLKALVWCDAAGVVRLGYNDPAWIARRHGLEVAEVPAVAGLSQVLAKIAEAAAGVEA